MPQSTNIVVLTGAGISQESNLPTFRGVQGLWNGYRIEEVANPRAYRRDPGLVHDFYNMRRRNLQGPEIGPNAAHRALAELERDWTVGEFCLITQNVDDLHERAGSNRLIHLHGELLKARCTETGEVFDWREDLSVDTPHPRRPELRGTLRPHIVWFGEIPFDLPLVYQALGRCDLFVAIGTSGLVYPAAGFSVATPKSCRRVEINLDHTPVASGFHETIRGPATVAVPAYCQKLRAMYPLGCPRNRQVE